MGIPFEHKDVVNGEWSELKERHARKNRTKNESEIDMIAKSKVRKPKKVKPGYKRGMKWEMDIVKKRERRIKARKK